MADNVSTFTEGQDVTSDMLNDIVKDLGNADFSYFTEGEPYAVDKLNEITKALVTKGVLMSENKCAVTYSNGNITVGTGTIVFGSGSKMKMTSARTFSAYTSKATYVYAKHDTATNKIMIWKTTNEVVEDDYIVVLALVALDGTVTDLRPFCKAKCNLNVANQTETVQTGEFTVSKTVNGTVVYTIPLAFSGYNALYINSGTNLSGSSDRKGFLVLPDSKESERFYVSNYRYVTFKKTNAGIDIYGYSTMNPDAGEKYSLNITLY